MINYLNKLISKKETKENTLTMTEVITSKIEETSKEVENIYKNYPKEVNLLEFNIPFEIENIDYIMFSGKKKYAMSKNNIMVTKGYLKNKGAKDAIIFLKKHIRNDKLEELGL
jgi:hypothetical protein